MFENQSRKEVILILPYLSINTTSVNRFLSFIRAFQNQKDVDLKVIEIDYGIHNQYFAGHENECVDESYDEIENLSKITPSFNYVQKSGFKYLNKGNFKLWKFFQLLHLLIFRTDIFNPGKINTELITGTKGKYEAGYIIVSGGHFSYFSSAAYLARKLNYKLVLDYRDPWTFGYPPVGGFKLVHWIKILISRNTEIKLLKAADFVSTVSSTLRSYFTERIRNKVSIVPNGSNYKLPELSIFSHPTNFNIVYAGTVYDIQLRSNTFFKAFQIFIKGKDRSKIRLYFLGSFYNKNLKNKVTDFNLEDVCFVKKRLKSKDLLTYLENASAFLHLKYGYHQGIITSKQADYLLFRKPIILPESDNGDIAHSILLNKAGFICNSVDENISVLELLWKRFINGENQIISQSEEVLKSNSREEIAKNFVKLVLNS